MMKLMTIALASALAGFAGTAFADDMNHMDMGAMTGTSAAPPVQVAATEANAVTIGNFAFSPQTVTVKAGTTVTWTNRDDEPHTVFSDDDPRAFKSAGLDTDEKFSFTFAQPGTYKYHCSIHPHMTGTIVVR